MIDATSVAFRLGAYALELKKMVDEHKQIKRKLYKKVIKLQMEIEELEELRTGAISDSLSDLDKEVFSLQTGLVETIGSCKVILGIHEAHSFIGIFKSYTNLGKVKDQIQDLTEEVNSVKQKFLMRTQIMQTTVLSTQFTMMFNVKEDIDKLQQNLEKMFMERNFPSLANMTKEERETSLKEASLDLALTSREADREALSLKISILQKAIQADSGFLSPERTVPPKKRSSYAERKPIPEGLERMREDAIIEVIRLLRALEDPDTQIVPIVWFRRGDKLSSSLRDIGFHAEALLLSEICHAVIIRIYQMHGDFYAPDLAASYHNLGNRMTLAKRHAEAAKAYALAVELRSKLVETNAAKYSAGLAHSYYNLAKSQYEIKQYLEASVSSQRSKELYEPLAAKDPKPFRANLADSCYFLGRTLSLSGKDEEAIQPLKKSIEIRTTLALINPDTYDRFLAHSYHALATSYSKSKKYQEALEQIEFAIELRTKLMKQKSTDYSADIADSYDAEGYYHEKLEDYAKASESREQAVKIRTSLEGKRPGSHSEKLARSLAALRFLLGEQGRYEEAVKVAEKVVHIWEGIAIDGVPSHILSLADSLNGLACHLGNWGKYAEALEKMTRCLDLHLVMMKTNSDNQDEEVCCRYGNALETYSDILEKAGRHQEALDVAQEAIPMVEKGKEKAVVLCPKTLKLLNERVERLKDAVTIESYVVVS